MLNVFLKANSNSSYSAASNFLIFPCASLTRFHVFFLYFLLFSPLSYFYLYISLSHSLFILHDLFNLSYTITQSDFPLCINFIFYSRYQSSYSSYFPITITTAITIFSKRSSSCHIFIWVILVLVLVLVSSFPYVAVECLNGCEYYNYVIRGAPCSR